MSTFDLGIETGDGITLEHRDEGEVIFQEGPGTNGKLTRVMVANPGSDVLNPAFDVTPAELITGIITEKGITSADRKSIEKLFDHD